MVAVGRVLQLIDHVGLQLSVGNTVEVCEGCFR